MVLRRYLFHSLLKRVLFRGAFSIGYFFEDAETNTVLGEAVADAAAWYARADWAGISSTPGTNNVIDHYIYEGLITGGEQFLVKYGVPLNDGTYIDLYSISWPGAFCDPQLMEQFKQTDSRRWFFELLKDIGAKTYGTEI
jgi:hypothetical protein